MNILLIVTNRYRGPVPVIPLGACLVAESCERAGHKVQLLDLMFEHDPLRSVESALDETHPDVIGLSVRNIDNNDMQHPVAFFKELTSLVGTLRGKTQATLILGGAAVGVMPEALLRFTGADWAVLGDGEIVLPKALDMIAKNEAPDHMPGIAWIDENGIRIRAGYGDRFSAFNVAPDFQKWIDVHAYLSRLSTIPVQTKLGCHFKCVYCTYRKIEGNEYRLRDPDNVYEVINDLTQRGMRDIEFVDNVFNSPHDHALAICDVLARLQTKARLQSLELNPLFVDDALLGGMEKTGFVGVGITVESAADPVLDRLQKGFTARDVYTAAEVIRRHSIPCLWIFMLGGPGETEETIQETVSFVEKHIRPKDVVFFNVGIRIYPGTELERIARNEGVITVAPQDMLEPVFYVSPSLDREWLVKKIRTAMAVNMNSINSDSIALPFLSAIHYAGHMLGIRPPLWKHTRYIRRGLRWFGMDV